MADREDVARLAGVSSATVSRVINGNAGDARQSKQSNQGIGLLSEFDCKEFAYGKQQHGGGNRR